MKRHNNTIDNKKKGQPISGQDMTVKQFISFLGALVLTAFVYTFLLYVIVMSTFSFAGETLDAKENREAFFFYSSVFVVAATSYIIYQRSKANQKFSAVGIAIPLLFALYIMFVTGHTCFDNLNYHQAFDRTKWRQSEAKPFKMAKTITKDDDLIGQTRQQMINKFGLPKDSLKNNTADYFTYSTDKGTWEFRLYFKNDKVTEAYLYEEGLGI